MQSMTWSIVVRRPRVHHQSISAARAFSTDTSIECACIFRLPNPHREARTALLCVTSIQRMYGALIHRAKRR
jgi:hypothetical protein